MTNLNRKIALGLVAVAVGLVAYLFIQKEIYKNKYVQTLEKDYDEAKEKIEDLNIRVDSLFTNIESLTKKYKSKSSNIDKKLKQDEEDIDSRIITDDDVDKFLAKYKKS